MEETNHTGWEGLEAYRRAEEERIAGLKGAALESEKMQQADVNRSYSVTDIDVRTYTEPRFCPRSAIVTVLVGEQSPSHAFYIHEDLLTRHSRFFGAALRKDWVEAEEKLVRLPDDDPLLFEIFTDFLYNGRIYSTRNITITRDPDDTDDDEAAARDQVEWDRLALCWVLGDKLGSHRFQDAAIDSILQIMIETGRVPLNIAVHAYASTVGVNPLRRLAVDIAAWRHDTDDFDLGDPSHWQTQFHRDAIARLQERSCMVETSSRDGPDVEPWRGDWPCELYHMHSDDFRTPAVGHDCYRDSIAFGGSR